MTRLYCGDELSIRNQRVPKRTRKLPDLGENEYRQGALERIRDAETLMRREQYAGAIYMAGRAVEGMLRGLIWKSDTDVRRAKTSLDTGHDLRELVTRISNLGLLRADGHDDDFVASVQRIARLWFNNMRFASSRFVETRWWKLKEVRRKRTFKEASSDYFNACSAVVRRCEALWQR